MSAMTLEKTQAAFPLDLSGLDTLIDPEDYDKEVHGAIRNQLQQGGLVSPTKDITNFQLEPDDTPGFLDSMMQKIGLSSPEVYDSSNPDAVGNYMSDRFEFITGHEDYREKVYRDSRKRRTIGYGFNLDEPTNRALYKNALKKTDREFDALRNGTAAIDPTQARILFEASAGEAERLITNRFGGLDLKGYQRMALVSLAYNHPNLIGPGLTKALRNGDLEGVDHEIRNRSNLYKIKGIASRRALEADMFKGMGNDSGSFLAKVFGPSQAQASVAKAPEPEPEESFLVKAAGDVIKPLMDFKVIPEPAELLSMALVPFLKNNSSYRKSEMATSTQNVLHEVVARADKESVTQVPYDFYPTLKNGLSAKAMLGDATRWDAKKKDWIRHTSGSKKGQVKFFAEDHAKYAAMRKKVYGELTPASMLEMLIDMQTDPVFRAVGTIGQFSIQKGKNGRFIKERFNFNSYSRSMGDAYAALRTTMGKLGVAKNENEGPLVVFPIDGAVTEDELLGSL